MATDASWNSDMPAAYDRWMGPILFEPYARFLSERIKAYAPQRVLELAAGTGIVTKALVAALPEAEVVATDLNDAMVDYGAQQAPGAKWQRADALDLPFGAAEFDVVACQFGVMFFPDKAKGVSEMKRVLRAHGRAVFLVWTEISKTTFDSTLNDVLLAMYPETAPTFIERTPHGYYDQDVIAADVERGGMIVESIETVALSARGVPRDAALGYCNGSPVRFELEKRGDLAELTEQVALGFEERLGKDEVEGSLESLLVVAR